MYDSYVHTRIHAKGTMVTNDTTVSLARHMRRIQLENGPTVSTKKNKLKRRHSFQVTELRLSWYGEDDPMTVTAYGYYIHKKGHRAYADRSYDLASGNVPKWIKDAING